MPDKGERDHGKILADIMEKEKFKKFAEIGVWKSKNIKRVMHYEPSYLEEYWAIDPWDINFAHSRTERRRSELNWWQMYNYCCYLMKYYPQLKVVRMTSELASEIFPDGYFDMVFIDAVHTFEQVSADIGYWLPKVRKDGIISGHDYDQPRWPGVKKAVDKWFGEKNIKFWEHDWVWMKRI